MCQLAGDELVARFSRSLSMLGGWRLACRELKRGPSLDKSTIKAEPGGRFELADSLCDVHCSTCRLSQRARQDDLRHEETACRHQPYTAARIYSSPLLSASAAADPPATASPASARVRLPPALPFAPTAPPSLFSLTSTLPTIRPGASYTLCTPLATSPTDIPFSPTRRQHSH